MAIDILMPPLSQTMDSLVLVEWSKKVGDSVAKGETLFVVETDKAMLEVESPGAGTVREMLAAPGDEIKIGAKIGVIAEAGDAAVTDARPASTGPSTSTSTSTSTRGVRDEEHTRRDGQPLPAARQNRIFASPRARELAQQEGIELASIRASGPQGMIVERDVRAVVEQRQAQPKITPVARRVAEAAGLDVASLAPATPGAPITREDVETAIRQQPAAMPEPSALPRTRVALSPIRKTIARRLQSSHQTTAPVTLNREVDATELVQLRAGLLAELAEGDPRPTYTDLLVSIVARCLGRHPHFNALFDGDALSLRDEVNMGLAMDTERGLFVPVIRDAQRKGLLELALERSRLVQRVTDGAITPDEMSDGTFTLTNLGSLGVDSFTPIINPPQVAILGVGRIRPVLAVHENQVAIRQILFLSLTFDHRAVDGAPSARLLNDIAQMIEKPHRVWL